MNTEEKLSRAKAIYLAYAGNIIWDDTFEVHWNDGYFDEITLQTPIQVRVISDDTSKDDMQEGIVYPYWEVAVEGPIPEGLQKLDTSIQSLYVYGPVIEDDGSIHPYEMIVPERR